MDYILENFPEQLKGKTRLVKWQGGNWSCQRYDCQATISPEEGNEATHCPSCGCQIVKRSILCG